jgi:hypothetical protein
MQFCQGVAHCYTEMEIYKFSIDFLNLHPRVWIFCGNRKDFHKGLETFSSRIFFSRFLKSIGQDGFDFPMNFWLLFCTIF